MFCHRATGLGSVCVRSSCDPRRRGASHARGFLPLSNALPGSVAFIVRIGLSGAARPRGRSLFSARKGRQP